eukprot:SAG11_NODE_9231_length_931_cov_0.796875_1_plen_122_part_10
MRHVPLLKAEDVIEVMLSHISAPSLYEGIVAAVREDVARLEERFQSGKCISLAHHLLVTVLRAQQPKLKGGDREKQFQKPVQSSFCSADPQRSLRFLQSEGAWPSLLSLARVLVEVTRCAQC